MKIPRKLETILMGILLAAIPALFAGLLVYGYTREWIITGIVTAGIFGFGLDIAFGKGCR